MMPANPRSGVHTIQDVTRNLSIFKKRKYRISYKKSLKARLRNLRPHLFQRHAQRIFCEKLYTLVTLIETQIVIRALSQHFSKNKHTG